MSVFASCLKNFVGDLLFFFRELPQFFNCSSGYRKKLFSWSYVISKKSFLNCKNYIWITFLQTLLFELTHLMLHACQAWGWVTVQNFQIKTNVPCTFYFRFAHFRHIFTSGILHTRLLLGISIHLADASFWPFCVQATKRDILFFHFDVILSVLMVG